MRKYFKHIISLILVLSLIFAMTVPALAAGTETEEYISEIRLIYAEDYDEAKDILADSEFSNYKILDENLNKDTGEIGVWLAYKTTTNIDDAITDLAVMQMNGGYTEGNYQEMIKQSLDEYTAMGNIYVEAIEYFVEAYDAGHFLAESAYRQLNFYNGLDGREEEKLGDVFCEGIDAHELATMFLEGNSYVLRNVRSLIAMGVAYNEDGTTYLERVGIEAAELLDDPDLYDGEDYDELAFLISPTINVFRSMFEELDAYDSDLDYEDDTLTSLEVKYMEYKAIASMMNEIEYLDGKTLYEFCLEYEVNEEDYSSLYPLVAALNDGQIAMTKVAHYYDVVRYSMGVYPENTILEKLDELEEKYSENPFDIYTGVDRTIYDGTFALTSAASRADAYNEAGLAEAFFGEGNFGSTIGSITMFSVGLGLFWVAIEESADSAAQGGISGGATTGGATLDTSVDAAAGTLVKSVEDQMVTAVNDIAREAMTVHTYEGAALEDVLNSLFVNSNAGSDSALLESWANMDFSSKFNYFETNIAPGYSFNNNVFDKMAYSRIRTQVYDAREAVETAQTTAEQNTQNAVEQAASNSSSGITLTSGLLYLAGGILMLYSAFRLGKTLWNYYHPDYEDVPIAMVDLVYTDDGDRYIKYDVVYNAETNEDGIYEAADLNAFEAKLWNALYYTKSYEAGKPLLADSFMLSNSSNKPKAEYAPVHKFGDVVCYDLNKYNFDGDTSIYLSIKQSKNDKSAVADVPELVGSAISAGFIFLAGGIGAAVGVGGAILTQHIINKKKSQPTVEDPSAEA